jgi:hypothetical protein
MANSALDRKTASWLDAHVREWVAADLISADQAAAVRRHERLEEPMVAPRLTVVAEVASYLGSVIAIAGGAAIIGPSWDDLRFGGQLALTLTIAVVGFAAGAWLVDLGETGTLRLGWFLWVIGTGGAAMTAVVVTNWIDPREDAWFAVAIGLTVAVLGLGLWRNKDRPLQMLTAAGGSLVAYAGILQLTDVSVWIAAPVLQAGSVAFGAWAALDHVRPRLVALMASGVGLMVGALLYSDASERFSAIATVVSAALIVVFALFDRSWPIVALGLLGFFIGTTALMQAVLNNTLSRFVALVLGLLVVAYVAVRAQRMGRTGRRQASA